MKKDFNISTGGLGAIKTFISIYIVMIVVICAAAVVGEIMSGMGIIILLTIAIGFFIVLPAIIFCSLITMLIDYMYNIQEQSKILADTNIITKKILKELEVTNSFNEEKVQA